MKRWLAQRRKGAIGLATLIVALSAYLLPVVPDRYAAQAALIVGLAGVIANYGVPNSAPPAAGRNWTVPTPTAGTTAEGPLIYRNRPDVPLTYGSEPPPDPGSVGFPKT